MANVLLIDDHVDLRDVVTQLLEIHGHTVEYCATAGAALDALRCSTPDAVILDQRLPDMNGLELLKQLRRMMDHSALPIIVYSADDSDADEAMSAGADDFWLKGSDRLFEGIEQLGLRLNAAR